MANIIFTAKKGSFLGIGGGVEDKSLSMAGISGDRGKAVLRRMDME